MKVVRIWISRSK